jgi:HSP20 family molecular chaperone IbpA
MKRESSEAGTVFDPPVHMTDDDRYIHVSIGLPGTTEEQIRIDLEKTTFTVSVSEHGTLFKKTIQVPAGTRVFRKKFSDGVLKMTLEKPM